jgi:KTSC domain
MLSNAEKEVIKLTGQLVSGDQLAHSDLIGRAAAFNCIMNKDVRGMMLVVLGISKYTPIAERAAMYDFVLSITDGSPLLLEACSSIGMLLGDTEENDCEYILQLLERLGNEKFVKMTRDIMSKEKAKARIKEKEEKLQAQEKEEYDWVYPVSSSVYRYIYVPKTEMLHVVFKSNKNRTYTYEEVDEETYQALQRTSSKGTFIHEELSGRFPEEEYRRR